MKIVVKRLPFLAALETACSVTPAQSMRPGLKNALFRGDAEGNLDIEATDMEVGIRVRVKAESIDGPGAGCLPCHSLAKLLKESRDELVSLDVAIKPQEKDDFVNSVLSVGLDVYEIPGMGHQYFPILPKVPTGEVAEIKPEALNKMLARTIPSASKNAGHYALNGVFLQGDGKILNAVATDGCRLTVCKHKLKVDAGLKEGVILPLKMANELRHLCDETPKEELLHFALSGRQFTAWNSTAMLSSLLVEGFFPKYQPVIPKDLDKEATFNREVLLSALRRAEVLSDGALETRAVQFDFSTGLCTITNIGQGSGKATIKLAVEYTGEPIWVRLDTRRLVPTVGLLDVETVRMEMLNPSRPVIIREGQDFTFVLMSVKDNDGEPK